MHIYQMLMGMSGHFFQREQVRCKMKISELKKTLNPPKGILLKRITSASIIKTVQSKRKKVRDGRRKKEIQVFVYSAI